MFQKSFNFTVTLFIARQIKRPHFHIFPSVSAFLFPILSNKETLTSLDMPELFRKVLMSSPSLSFQTTNRICDGAGVIPPSPQ